MGSEQMIERSVAHKTIEETVMYKLFSDVSDECWNAVIRWNSFAKSTMGRQLVSSADSICANLSEGGARYGNADAIHFFVIARSSAREARYWILLATRRRVIPAGAAEELTRKIDAAGKALNGFINYRRAASSAVKEHRKSYPPAAEQQPCDGEGTIPASEFSILEDIVVDQAYGVQVKDLTSKT